MAAKKRMVLIISLVMALMAGREVCATEWVKISGTVHYEDTPLCVMVLANGEYMFTDAADGWYQMDVPLGGNGKITLFSFCDGFAPFKRVLEPWEARNYDIGMSLATVDSSTMTITINQTSSAKSGWVKLEGEVRNQSGAPLCAMVLANGEYIFSCQGDGAYHLEVPLDSEGNITLLGFCEGNQPYKKEWNGAGTTWYKDTDRDGYSDGTTNISADRPHDYYPESELIAKSGDTDDYDPNIHPETQEIKYSLPFLQLITTIGYNGEVQTVIASNTPKSVYIGKPVLPVIPATIVLPNGHELDHVEVVPGEKITLSGSHTVEHGQQPYPLLPDISPLPTPQNSEVYESDTVYPEKLYDTVGVQKLSGVSMLMVNLNPMEYKPVSGELAYYKILSLKVVTNPKSLSRRRGNAVHYRQSQVMRRMEVDNPEILDTYADLADETDNMKTARRGICKPSDSYQYVLITGRDIKNANTTPNVHDLIAHRQAQGMSATIVTVEDIYAEYSGVDKAEQVRNFIIDAYNNWETEYVLLGGDTNIIPMRKLWCRSWDGWDAEIDDIPSDLYYQCLDGNYNSDGDSKWGEPNDGDNGGDVDLLAEVYVGRASAENASEMANFVYKTIAYENDSSSYKTSALMCGEHLGFGGVSEYAKNSMEEIRLGSSEHGYNTVGFASNASYYVGVLYDRDGTWQKSAIVDKINSNAYSIINHLGHANYSYVMKMYNSDADGIGSSKFVFAYSQGCIPGDFERDCIAEHLTTSTRSGMFAVVFNSRYGWGTRDSTDGPSQRFNREFWDAFFGEDLVRFGEMNADSHEDNAWRIDQPCMRWCYYESNLLGDPAVSPVSDTPVCIYSISPGSKSFEASGGTGSVKVETQDGCDWNADTNVSWITITSAGNGSGEGSVNYSVDSYSGAGERTGTVAIAGKIFTVMQADEDRKAPVADAGEDKTVYEGDRVTLNGSGTDADGYIVSYEWEKMSGPGIGLSNTASAEFVFTAPEVDSDGITLEFQLRVTDNDRLSGTDTCVIYVEDRDEVVYFPDENLEAIIREAIGKPSGSISASDLQDLTSLDYSDIGKPDDQKIKNLEGIQYCTNLTSLDLGYNQISDINAVAGLSNLTSLDFGLNQIGDISAIADLTNLTRLGLYDNRISDVSAVAGLTNLTWLHLASNQITDISAVAGLISLTELGLYDNQISDISAVAGLTNLTWLHLASNQISDISAVVGLTSLTGLDFNDNQISDISAVAGLANLTWLDLDSNQISDISTVVGLTSLTWLDFNNNEISDISALADLTNLRGLYLDSNQISNINAVAGLNNLSSLIIDSNQISDISALAGLTNLKWLDLYGNQISNIKPLVDNSGIKSGDTVYLSYRTGESNPLSTTSCTVYIPQLQSRGVTVKHDCP